MMAGSVARLPNGASGGDDGIPSVEVYKVAVDEYRFQAQFNWSRTQYMLVFHAGILVAGTVVASRPGRSAALVYLLGILGAGLSIFVVQTQHE